MRFFIITQNKTNSLNLSQLLGCSLGIATGCHQQGAGILAMGQSEPVPGFAVGNMSNRAGI
jgi:hypothetical protein